MSLIQEALRRKAEESGQPAPPGPILSPPRKRRSWVPAFVLLFLWAVAGVILEYGKGGPSPPKPGAGVGPPARTRPPASTEARTPFAPSVAPELFPGVQVEPVPPHEPAAEESASPPQTPAEAAEPRIGPATGEPEWPAIKLMGVMAGRGVSKPSALLNGVEVEVEETLSGVRLLNVEPGGVWLEYGGEKKYLRVGQELP